MSGYWHDADCTTVGTAPAGSMIRPGDDLPVDDGKIALFFGGDETTVIEGEKDYLIGLLELALDKVKATNHNDPIPGDFLPEDTYYWPDEWEERPDFITRDGGETWTPLCDCGRDLEPLRGNSMANWECTNYDYHGRLQMVLIWAEDWPNYDPDEEDDDA